MGKRDKQNNVVGLDIGTTKICAMVAEITDEGVNVIGIGTHPSVGLRKGVVVNIESTVNSIRKAVEEAELMAGFEITDVFAGIAGGHIKGFNSTGMITVKDGEIGGTDIKRVIDTAKAISIPLDREVIHVIPQEYIIDGQDGIKEPLGMSGLRLEAKIHIVTAAVTSAQNIIKCANRTGLNVSDIVLEQLASAEAVLTNDEKELGVALIDIGGGTTDIAIFNRGSIKHTAVISIGGEQITNDIAIGLRTPTAEAEIIKKKFGCAVTSMVPKEAVIEVPSVGGRKPRQVSKQVLASIIEPRIEEVFDLVKREVIKAGFYNQIPAGVVITGGSTILEGMPELAEEIFGLPVRRGYPIGIGGLVDIINSPMYATGVGLVLYGARKMGTSPGKFRVGEKNIFAKVMKRMKEWIEEFF